MLYILLFVYIVCASRAHVQCMCVRVQKSTCAQVCDLPPLQNVWSVHKQPVLQIANHQ